VEDWIKALWEAAQALGLTSRWEFWVAVLALLVVVVMAKRLGPGAWGLLKGWHDVKPEPDPLDKPPSTPMDASSGGTPASSGTIPVPGPTGPKPGEGAP
jgi:hypothetical protein